MNKKEVLKKAPWLGSEDIRPYVFVRPENSITMPGMRHKLDWFSDEPIVKNPLRLEELSFANQIYWIEGKAFGPANMEMPRWVFYDCAVVPGFVAGFACRASKLPNALREVLRQPLDSEWVPLSLFIIIPTMHKGEWVAHNLCTINSLLSNKADQLYGLGFLSKAFGLWYANVELCTGFTQWGNTALKLHSHYGDLEVIGAYAPIHSHAKTITYRAKISTSSWEKFFSKEENMNFLENYEHTEFIIDPLSEESMIELQRKIEKNEGPFYLNANEVQQKTLKEKLSIYRPKQSF
jgi:hypothetical protein